MEEWSPTGPRIQIDYLPTKEAVWPDDPIPGKLEPEIPSAFRARVLERVDEGSYRLAAIDGVDAVQVFGTPERAREHAEELLDHPKLRDARSSTTYRRSSPRSPRNPCNTV